MTQEVQIQKIKHTWVLTLQSPHSQVNILTRSLAKVLLEFFQKTQFQKEDWILFRSLKPHSFLNGAELLLTQGARCVGSLEQLAPEIFLLYQTMERCCVPIVSLIEGNCFGCGLEFTLCHDYRIGVDQSDTYFYMTEIPDYALLPVFGALEKLGRVLKLSEAFSFVVEGVKWEVGKACKKGLIDAVFKKPDLKEVFCFFEKEKKTHKIKKSLKKSLLKKPLLPYLETEKKLLLNKIQTYSEPKKSLASWALKILMHPSLDGRKAIYESFLKKDARMKACAYFFSKTMSRTLYFRKARSFLKEEVVLFLPKHSEPIHGFLKWFSHVKLPNVKIVFQKTSDETYREQKPCDGAKKEDARLEKEEEKIGFFRKNAFFIKVGKHQKRMFCFLNGIDEKTKRVFSSQKNPVWIYIPKGKEDFLEVIGGAEEVKSFLTILDVCGFSFVWSQKQSVVQVLEQMWDVFLKKHFPKGENERVWEAFQKCFFKTNAETFSEDFQKKLYAFLRVWVGKMKFFVEQGIWKHASEMDVVLKEVFSFPVWYGPFSQGWNVIEKHFQKIEFCTQEKIKEEDPCRL